MLLSPECVKLEAVALVCSVRSEIVAVKVGGDVIRPSSAVLLCLFELLWTSGGRVSFS